MKKVIRNGTFETASSSVHAICINKDSKEKDIKNGRTVVFEAKEYGWGPKILHSQSERASYLYTAMACCLIPWGRMSMDFERAKNWLYHTLSNAGVICDFNELPWDWEYDCPEYGIDHCDELADWVNRILYNEKKLLEYMFGDVTIIIGNDNNDWYSKKLCEYKQKTDKYDIYEKGN